MEYINYFIDGGDNDDNFQVSESQSSALTRMLLIFESRLLELD
jgi:hypothetical protein